MGVRGIVTAEAFHDAATRMINREKRLHSVLPIRWFRARFGVQPHVCAIAFNKINLQDDFRGVPAHFLCECMVLKVYGTEDMHCSIAQIDFNTFRKCRGITVISSRLWIWCLLSDWAYLNWRKIQWEDLLLQPISADSHKRYECVTADCTDWIVYEPAPFSTS